MAGETGLEPAAFAVTGRRYNQLNYSPAILQCGANIVNLGNYRQGNSPSGKRDSMKDTVQENGNIGDRPWIFFLRL